MGAAMQYVQKMGWGDAEPVDAFLAFESESGGLSSTVVPGVGVVGSRDIPVERNRKSDGRVDLQQSFRPTPLELDTLLKYITGSNKSTNDFVPSAGAGKVFYNWVTRHDKIYKWSGCKVARATFEGSAGSPLTVSLEILGIDEDKSVASSSFPAGWAVDITGTPYMFHDCVFTVASTAYKFKSFRLVYDNMLDGERFFNSNRRVSIPEMDMLNVGVEVSGPYGDNAALIGSSELGVAFTATFTQSTRSLIITCPKVAFNETPVALDGKEWMLPLGGRAMKSGTTPSITFTNDSTA